MIYQESRRFGYDPLMIAAIIITESHFRPHARSRVGATGLMQVMPFVAEDLAEEVTTKSPDLWNDDRPMEWTGHETLLDPVQNVRLGILHLSRLIIRFRSVREGIRAYNFGPTELAKWPSVGQRPAKQYVEKVFNHYRELVEKYGPRPNILRTRRPTREIQAQAGPAGGQPRSATGSSAKEIYNASRSEVVPPWMDWSVQPLSKSWSGSEQKASPIGVGAIPVSATGTLDP